MNKTKRKLILISSILDFLGAIFCALCVFACFLFRQDFLRYLESLNVLETIEYMYNLKSFYPIIAVGFALGFALHLCGGLCLITSIRGKGSFFNNNRKVFITGVVFTVMCGFFSIESILLYVAISMEEPAIETQSEMQEVKREQSVIIDMEKKKNKEDTTVLKKRIEELRKLRDQGVITEKEFKDYLIKLL